MKELKLKVFIEDESTCSNQCPFMEDGSCLLFSRELEDTVLEAGYVWAEDANPTKQRDYRCMVAAD